MTRDPDRPAFHARIRQLRLDHSGDDGIPEIAMLLVIPARTWENYESGMIIPDLTLLRLICRMGANPSWLLTGEGMPYSDQFKPIVQIVFEREG
jgi:transcriptional regulator with XRE-family HTH domain